MRNIFAVAALAAASLATNVAEQVQRGIGDPQGPPVGRGPSGKRKRMSEEHYELHDKFHGIAGRGRNGASNRAFWQRLAFKETRVGRRNRDAVADGPIFISKNRNRVFLAAIAAGQTRNQALKIARRAEA